MIIFRYETDGEMQQIIDEQTAKGLLLVEVQNVTEGNFLGFTDDPNYQPRTPIEKDVATLKSAQADILLAMVMHDIM